MCVCLCMCMECITRKKYYTHFSKIKMKGWRKSCCSVRWSCFLLLLFFLVFFPNFSQTISYATKGTDKMSMHPCINGYSMANWMKQKLHGFKHEWCVMCIGFGFHTRRMSAKTHCHTLHASLENTKREEDEKKTLCIHAFCCEGMRGGRIPCIYVWLYVYVFAHLYVDCVDYSQINETKWEKR